MINAIRNDSNTGSHAVEDSRLIIYLFIYYYLFMLCPRDRAQGNFVRLGKGPDAPRDEAIVNAESVLPLETSDALGLDAGGGTWGSCAVVGNSGVLRLTDLGRAIDSHDKVRCTRHRGERPYEGCLLFETKTKQPKFTKLFSSVFCVSSVIGASGFSCRDVHARPDPGGLPTLTATRACRRRCGRCRPQGVSRQRSMVRGVPAY